MIHRVRTAADFARTVRSGARSGRRNVVLYGAKHPASAPSRVGFIVGKNVGNAVTRNLVKRRLRQVAAGWVAANPCGYDVVVRALPPAGEADWPTLRKDLLACLGTVERKLGRSDQAEQEGGVS
ncbi:ribonuclease P protein component [Arthrobacter agilis]|uniref:ribonuclease P protein component n=1 Tax=Arthrobacter agilis TaxID=37921 RepID=UPI00277D0BA8|nr:ribonuclease P protein component [Arthrobacter agilis]